MTLEDLSELLAPIGVVSIKENTGVVVHFGFTRSKESWEVTYADGVVYALIDKGEVVYIGHTLNKCDKRYRWKYSSNMRLAGHRNKKQYDYVLFCHIVHEDTQYITDCERCMILKAQPKYNKQMHMPKKYNF